MQIIMSLLTGTILYATKRFFDHRRSYATVKERNVEGSNGWRPNFAEEVARRSRFAFQPEKKYGSVRLLSASSHAIRCARIPSPEEDWAKC
jgi:hypothetical protein